MAWYDAGTVNVTLNSAVVTGVGTQWAASARQGEAFVGPDGRLYEVLNIASNTSLMLTRPYRGLTQAAQPYALAPFQGYVKELADRAAELLRRYSDVSELAKGAVQKSSVSGKYGSPPGSILPAGAYGQGGDPDAYPHVSVNLPAEPGVYFCTPDNTDTPGTFGILIREGKQVDPTVGTWLLDRFNSTNGHQYWRTKTNSDPWSAWVQTLTVGNAYGLLGLKSAAFADLIGDVGVGAAMQSGSNANGRWWRFQNGLQICVKNDLLRQYLDQPVAANLWSTRDMVWTFPMAFVAGGQVSVGGWSGSQAGNAWVGMGNYTISTTNCALRVIAGYQNTNEGTFSAYAIGGWKL